MNRKLFFIAALVAASAAASFAQEEKGVSVDAWFGVSVGDVLSEAALVTKYGVVAGNLFGTGLEAGIDELVWTMTSESAAGLDAYISYGFGAGASPLSFGVGAKTTLALDEDSLFGAGIYGTVGYSVNDVEVVSAELDAGFLSRNKAEFSLSAVVGGGYEFAIGEADVLSLWVDFNFDLYDEAALGDIEGSVEYTHPLSDAFALSLAVAPTVVMGGETSFALEPTLYARFSF